MDKLGIAPCPYFTAHMMVMLPSTPAIPNSERICVVLADQAPLRGLKLNDKSRVSSSKNFEFGIAASTQPVSMQHCIRNENFLPIPMKGN
jgi:hypothetical protein